LFDGVLLKDIGNLSVGLNLDYLKEGDTNWFGVSAMGRFIINDSFYVAARAEYVKSKNTAMFGPTFDGSLYEFTGLGAWTVGKHYELRAEVRADMSDKDTAGFMKGTTAKKNQVTGLLAALAYF
jgi:Putative beta-barrel porin-2, OmpL-like. bbp2